MTQFITDYLLPMLGSILPYAGKILLWLHVIYAKISTFKKLFFCGLILNLSTNFELLDKFENINS